MIEKTKITKKISTLNIIGIVLLIIFVPLIIMNMILIIKGWVDSDKIPMLFNRAPLIVVSDSMTIEKDAEGNIVSGAFNKNDLIFIKKVDPSTLTEGDIITYIAEDGSVVTHRIFEIKKIESLDEYIFTMKGDFNNSIDNMDVTSDQIVGIYTGRIGGFGKVANFLGSPLGIVVILGIPLAILLVVDLLKKKKDNQQVQSKNAELELELAKLKSEKAQFTKQLSEESDEKLDEKK